MCLEYQQESAWG